MKKDFPYLGCVLLVAAFVIEFLIVYFAGRLISLPWWVALLTVVAFNVALGFYQRVRPKKKEK